MFRLIGQKDLRLHSQFWSALAFHVGTDQPSNLTAETLGPVGDDSFVERGRLNARWLRFDL